MSNVNIKSLPVLDKTAAIEGLGDEDLFIQLLRELDTMSMSKNLTELKMAMDSLD